MDETATNPIDDAVRELERTIYRAVEGALCVFERRTGLQPKEVEVVMCSYGPRDAPKYELDVVLCHLPTS
jgi:hypothetical protein